LNAFLAQCGYCVGTWRILGIIDEGVNSKTQILLQFWNFHRKTVDEAWSLLEWIAWDSIEFDKASCVYGYSFYDPCAFYARSYYALFWCDMCNSSAHNVSSCPYYACYAHPDSYLPLTQSMRLEAGESFGLVSSFGMSNALCGLEDTFNVEHNLVDTPLEGCGDVFLHKGSPSLAYDKVIPNSLEHSHVFTFCSPLLFAPELDFDVPIDNFEICDYNVHLGHEDNMFHMLGENVDHVESLGNFSGYDAALDPYCMNLVETPRKIMWTPFFTFSFDFSMAFALLTRVLIFLVMFIVVVSQHHTCEPHAVEFGKLLYALTVSDLRARVLTSDEVVDAP